MHGIYLHLPPNFDTKAEKCAVIVALILFVFTIAVMCICACKKKCRNGDKNLTNKSAKNTVSETLV